MQKKLTRNQAEKILETYCIDAPLIGAVDRLINAPVTVTDEARSGFVQVCAGLYARQDQIDKLIYGGAEK